MTQELSRTNLKTFYTETWICFTNEVSLTGVFFDTESVQLRNDEEIEGTDTAEGFHWTVDRSISLSFALPASIDPKVTVTVGG